MLYPKNTSPELSPALFQNPTCEYRGTPFWAWNGKLDDDELKRQIEIFKQMGLGGFHMHVRTGLDTPYMTNEYMEHIRFCVEEAKREDMLAWLYDEDRWPSGSAGGKVTDSHPEFARKSLMLTTEPYAPERPHQNKLPEPGRGQNCVRQDNGVLIAVYDIILNADGTLKSYKIIPEDAAAQGVKWYAYMEHASADPWFNNQAYVDTLKQDAVGRFIELTHQKYYESVGKDFGGVIPAIFTDEPQFCPKNTLNFALEQKDVFMPWTDELPQSYFELYGESLIERVPELIWELPNKALSSARWRYQNTVTELFVKNYCRQVGEWCRAHGLKLTGHVMGEPRLSYQTGAVGDAMRCYPEFDIPGIDMLCDFHEYTTAVQTRSMVRQTGKEGMLSELYGVTGWDYDFRGYKLQGDWQAALGVSVRVPHLAWMSMKGEAKRDYPASISYQSPWWDRFSLVENHFARLNTALTRGKASVRVGVIHPIESFWLIYGPSDQTQARRDRMENQFASLTEALLMGTMDFDFINEATLPKLCEKGANPLQVGEMNYDAIIVPPVYTLRSSTLERLNEFVNAGGRLIFTGDCPKYIDAMPSDEAAKLYDISERVPFDTDAILEALEEYRFIDLRYKNGSRVHHLISSLRKDGDALWLFVCNGKNPVSPDVDDAPVIRFTLSGEYDIELYDTLSGEISSLPAKVQNGKTIFERPWHIHDSILLRLSKYTGAQASFAAQDILGEPDIIMGEVDVSLDEPNMLLLDMAEYALNDGEFNSEEELLRIDNIARRALNIPVRRKEVVQPYMLKPETPENHITLRFKLNSEIDFSGAYLALESPEQTEIWLNGDKVEYADKGWYVDRSIRKTSLPEIKTGINELIIRVPVGRRTNLECFYLLGDFGVRVNGTVKTITAPVRRLGFGSAVPQGLPFYTGNIIYSFDVKSNGAFILRVPSYRGGLVSVTVDGKDAGSIAFSPYTLKIDAPAGKHRIELKLYGTRINGFGQLHHTQGIYFYQSPNSWRSAGDRWVYEYQLKPMGILKSPELYNAKATDKTGKTRITAEKSEHMSDQS